MTTPDHETTIDRIQRSDFLKHPANGTTDIYFVRHGQTVANASGRFAGVTDVELDETGLQQARELGAHFTTIQLDHVLSSPLSRARTTAEAIAEPKGMLPIIVDNLAEMNFGEAENRTSAEIASAWPELVPQLLDVHDTALRWPGGESRAEFHDRILDVVTWICEQHAGETVAAVCHGGVITSILAQLEDGPRADFVRYHVSNCSVTHLVVTPTETLIKLWDDTSHLTAVEKNAWKRFGRSSE